VQWFGQLLPVHLLLMRMGLTPPKHLLSDEKFAVLDGEKVYLFLVSEQELIWYGKWMSDSSEDCFTQTIEAFSVGMNESGHISGHLQEEEDYEPISATTDGWLASQNAWQSEFPDITLIECSFHGKKRVAASLDDYIKANPELSPEQIREVKDNFNAILTAPTLAAYSQRIRQNLIRYQEQPFLLKRLNILKNKRFLFTNYLKFKDAPPYSAPLDRSMRFLAEKLQSFGQFRVSDAINPFLNAWAMVNNLRAFLPDAKKGSH